MRLAIILSHPVQYYSPWFRYLAANGFPDLKVFYLWDSGVTEKMDAGFGVRVKWDIPLLEGYQYEFVPNVAARPGTTHIRGLNNPSLISRLEAFAPDAVLVFGYNYRTLYRLIFSRFARRVPLLFRGDSHLLGRQIGDGRRKMEGGNVREKRNFPSSNFQLRTSLERALRRLWITRVLRRFSAFLAVGKANHEYFRYHGIAEDRIFFCPHCVDNDRFFAESERAADAAREWKRELAIPANHRVILFAGKFEEKKRPHDLLNAFREAQLKDVSLLMVGNGAQETNLRREFCEKNIVFTPFQNQSLMPRTYSAGEIFVLPSFGSGETWGLAVNEAMCMGRPVVVSDHVGCAQDLVRNDENGLVFPAGDVGALTEALRNAFSDDDRLKRWGERSRSIVQNYSYAAATKGLNEALAFVRPSNSVSRAEALAKTDDL